MKNIIKPICKTIQFPQKTVIKLPTSSNQGVVNYGELDKGDPKLLKKVCDILDLLKKQFETTAVADYCDSVDPDKFYVYRREKSEDTLTELPYYITFPGGVKVQGELPSTAVPCSRGVSVAIFMACVNGVDTIICKKATLINGIEKIIYTDINGNVINTADISICQKAIAVEMYCASRIPIPSNVNCYNSVTGNGTKIYVNYNANGDLTLEFADPTDPAALALKDLFGGSGYTSGWINMTIDGGGNDIYINEGNSIIYDNITNILTVPAGLIINITFTVPDTIPFNELRFKSEICTVASNGQTEYKDIELIKYDDLSIQWIELNPTKDGLVRFDISGRELTPGACTRKIIYPKSKSIETLTANGGGLTPSIYADNIYADIQVRSGYIEFTIDGTAPISGSGSYLAQEGQRIHLQTQDEIKDFLMIGGGTIFVTYHDKALLLSMQ